jgi:hyaluronoglucosaminidase
VQLGRRKRTAAALAVAVIGGLFGGAPGAFAAPADGGMSPVSPDHESSSGLPAVYPRPQSMKAGGNAIPLGSRVTIVEGAGADPYAVAALADALKQAGVAEVARVLPAASLPATGPVVLAGGAGAQKALSALHAPGSADLPSGGYRLAIGTVAERDTVALDGVGPDGLFHAAQTFRQLILKDPAGGASMPGVVVRDWPGTAVRGTTEGFYGEPWTQADRLAQLDFMGRTKQNEYLYAPGDDPYRQTQWRDPYPAAQRADFRALAARARANHVTLAWAVAPAQAMCMASDDDVKALNRKIDAMWALGVRAFQLQFQDVSYSDWHCGEDTRAFGTGPQAAARAQVRVANAVAAHLRQRHPGSAPLSLMPTEYYQSGSTDYRTALGQGLDPSVQVGWTGDGVVPRTITGSQLAATRKAFDGHPLVTMDNYPVNDSQQGSVFLGPYEGRQPAVAAGSAGLLANAMQQAAVSRIPLFTAADYAWNPKGYQPQQSWQAAVDDLAGGDGAARAALGALAGNDSSSVLDPEDSAYLKPLIDRFWTASTGTDAAARDEAAEKLRAAFTVMKQAPGSLRGTAGGALETETAPWINQLARYGKAGELAVDMLQDQARGDGAAAWQASLELDPLRKAAAADTTKVGTDVLDSFLSRAANAAAGWTGASHTAGKTGVSTSEGYTVELGRARPLDAVTVMSDPGTGAGASVQAHVPGKGWRTLGRVSTSGWTQADGQGQSVDALRVSWPGSGAVSGVTGPDASTPVVHRVVPWFMDAPMAGLTLAKDETDVQSGGPGRTVQARVTSGRPGDVAGVMAANAPAGITVSLPAHTTVPRGRVTGVPVRVSASAATPSGTYRVPVSFAGAQTTLTVRVSPQVSGPDLASAPGAVAMSSADETSDFPASAANDGDPATRWSSPAKTNEWWQVRLAQPAHIGQVVLTWQDAYASRYRVQVSADGRNWRTAATVTDGTGGREAVGVDARDALYVRVQGDKRATQYGYSLFSVEVYGVAGPDAPPAAPPRQPSPPQQQPAWQEDPQQQPADGQTGSVAVPPPGAPGAGDGGEPPQ